MASISTDPTGNRIVQFTAGDGKRRTVRLGKADMKTVRDVARRVDALNVAQIAGQVIDRDLAEWLGSIGDKLHGRLAAVGLISPRAGAMPMLGAFLKDFIAKRDTGKTSTNSSRQVAANRLIAFFGENTALNVITAGQADEWLLWMMTTKDYAGATIGRTVKRAKEFFRGAVRLKVIRENPFADLKAPKQANEARKFFVSHDVAAQVLDACLDAEWRLIFALSRYGGLRCPQSILPWAGRTSTGRATASGSSRQKRGERWVPIFAELRPFLQECFERAEDGAAHVIARRRNSAQRWGMLLHRILAAAGITPWERSFHNLRASRQTELSAIYPTAAVCRWLGNSERIADAHYLMALESDFEKAAKIGALQNPVQQTATNGDEPLQPSTVDIAETLEIARNAKKHPEACKSQGG